MLAWVSALPALAGRYDPGTDNDPGHTWVQSLEFLAVILAGVLVMIVVSVWQRRKRRRK